jgi:two-component system, chemotaxis family, protein-glutamate methylesterase/glutaminase
LIQDKAKEGGGYRRIGFGRVPYGAAYFEARGTVPFAHRCVGMNRDIVVIGASAGGFDTLRSLLSALPSNLPASLFIVLHVGEISHLAGLLARTSTLPVRNAEQGALIEKGTVYVAIPGKHLLLHDHHILLRRGPRENQSRPAIDPLFRSAAATFGSRVIGVVLSGSLSDGTAGLQAIKDCGGVAVVQDPRDALVPDMPQSAIRNVDVDHVATLADLPDLLQKLTHESAGPTLEIPLHVRLEAAIAAQELSDMTINDRLGKPSRFTCPECHGALWEIEDGGILRFRCHVGHAYTADTALVSQSEEIDRLLGTLLRSHQERAGLARRMSTHQRAQGHGGLADQLAHRADDYDAGVELMKSLLRHGDDDRDVINNREEQTAAEHERDIERR